MSGFEWKTKFLNLLLLALLVQKVGPLRLFRFISRPSPIYMGLYNSKNTSEEFRVLKRDSYQYGCTPFNRSTEESCKFYGDCCVDPMRLRERLEPGTFSCEPVSNYNRQNRKPRGGESVLY